MAQDPSVSADAVSLLLQLLSDQEHLSLPGGYFVPDMCCNATLTHSTIGPLCGASGTKDVTDLLDDYMCMCIKSTAEEATLFKHEDEYILTVESEDCFAHGLSKLEFEDNFEAYKNRDMLCLCPRTTERDENYTAQKDGKTCKFKKSRYLAELTCKVQNCSQEFCAWCPIYPGLVENPMPRVKKSSWKELKLLNCTGDNVVRNGSKTVPTSKVLPNAITTPSTGTSSTGDITVASAVTGSLFLLVLFSIGLYKAKKRRRRRRSGAGSQGNSHGAAGDTDTQAEESV